MNKINRSLVKSQARQIIKGKVFYLFLITFIVTILTGGVTSVFNVSNNYDNLYDDLDKYYSDDFFSDYGDDHDYDFDDFYNDNNNPIEGFDYDKAGNLDLKVSKPAGEITQQTASVSILAGFGALISCIIAIVFAPLSVTLSGMYVSLIKRNANERFDLGKELSGVFKNSFNNTYLNKLILQVLIGLISFGLCLLFLVPGIIFHYSSYFSLQIMNEYPNLKPTEAIKLSKKIVKGNRWELFVYDLSFIPWYLLMFITFGFAGIYVEPYIMTATALYYENFRLRALADGRITEDDFLSDEERIMKYNNVNFNNGYQQNPYYNPNAGFEQNAGYQPYQATAQTVVNNNGTFYTPDFSPIDPFNPFANPMQTPPYQQPQGNGYYTPPQQPTGNPYYNPAPNAEQQNHNQYYNNQPNTAEQQTNPDQPTEPQPQDIPSEPSYYTPSQESESYNDTDNSNTENNEQ